MGVYFIYSNTLLETPLYIIHNTGHRVSVFPSNIRMGKNSLGGWCQTDSFALAELGFSHTVLVRLYPECCKSNQKKKISKPSSECRFLLMTEIR